jgi:hypothetical protein
MIAQTQEASLTRGLISQPRLKTTIESSMLLVQLNQQTERLALLIAIEQHSKRSETFRRYLSHIRTVP